MPTNGEKHDRYDLSSREKEMYESELADFDAWLRKCGHKPEENKPLADDTANNYMSRIKKHYRNVWNECGYVSTLSHAHADTIAEMLDEDLIRKENGEPYAESTKRKEVNTLSKYFFWLHDDREKEPWECDISFNEDRNSITDYFTKEEREQLRDAVLDYGSVPAYNNLSPADRSRWKAHIAQRLGKPKSEVDPTDWEYLNTHYKWVSLLWTALDAGLRPVEINRAKTSWLRLSKGEIHIPKKHSAKNRDNWQVALCSKTVTALRKWKEQRKNMSKYYKIEGGEVENDEEELKDILWLNREANPYNSGTLNYFLRNLLEKMEFDDENRDLTWYSIRHSTGTYLETEMGLAATADQLRHKNLQTTRRYTHTPTEYRQKGLENI